jgi:RimJ/RimL family protein N-acetyltransferase
MSNPIELETERLLLRQWRETDVEAYAQICADPLVMQYLTGKSLGRLESWRHIAFLIGHWQLKGFGHWAVEEKSTGNVIGRLGFLQPDDWPGFEIGWTLAKDSWGKGYATEGGNKALEHAFKTLKKEQVISIIHPQNEASKRVAVRLGESHQKDTEVMGIKVQIWGMSRTDWQAK